MKMSNVFDKYYYEFMKRMSTNRHVVIYMRSEESPDDSTDDPETESNRDWLEITRDKTGRILSFANSDGLYYKYTRDQNGNVLSYEDSQGFWYEYTVDKLGNVLSYKNSSGAAYEYTRDESGRIISYSGNSFGSPNENE